MLLIDAHLHGRQACRYGKVRLTRASTPSSLEWSHQTHPCVPLPLIAWATVHGWASPFAHLFMVHARTPKTASRTAVYVVPISQHHCVQGGGPFVFLFLTFRSLVNSSPVLLTRTRVASKVNCIFDPRGPWPVAFPNGPFRGFESSDAKARTCERKFPWFLPREETKRG